MKRVDGLDYIRRTYGVPAYHGVRVMVDGRPGMIIGTSGPHLSVALDEGKPLRVICHPTDQIIYEVVGCPPIKRGFDSKGGG